MKRILFDRIGPGPLIAAAFIGPGTVTLCSIAGVNFGYALLWAMLMSIVATIVLQEMSARLGLISQKGLAGVIREELDRGMVKSLVIFLILSAIVIGNAAYEAGNISGGVLGLSTLFPETRVNVFGRELNYLVSSLADEHVDDVRRTEPLPCSIHGGQELLGCLQPVPRRGRLKATVTIAAIVLEGVTKVLE